MSTKIFHEIRDSVHGFITIDTPERDVLDSPPVQRLRHIHQLAMGYLVYPGATHKRLLWGIWSILVLLTSVLNMLLE